MLSAFTPELSNDLKTQLDRVGRLSPFFKETAEKHPDLLIDSLSQCDEPLGEEALAHRYEQFLSRYGDLECASALRLLRRREMLRIIFRDLSRMAALDETTAALSALADYAINKALTDAFQRNVEKYGTPTLEDGTVQQMTVLAMGKLGARELNLSSDIDLIFFYSEPGVLQRDSGKEISYQAFFLKTARDFIACLDDASATEKVFRVDMRLRPYGDSGALVLPRAAMEKYYLEQGRDWERYAFIKARTVAGDMNAGNEFLDWMKGFVFRRHLDYGAILSLRDMKGLIARQIELKENHHDLKLGAGGIREIEFIGQALQLIWGGRNKALQEPRILEVLARLRQHRFITEDDLESLRDAYEFLRNSEHALQAQQDRQTHLLPNDDAGRERLAGAMGFDDYADYAQALDDHRNAVSRCFSSIIAESARDLLTELSAEERAAWFSPTDPELVGFRQTVEALQLSVEVIETLDLLMPYALKRLEQSGEPAATLTRLLAICHSILRRSTYLHFLCENLDALDRLVVMVEESPRIAELIQRYPIVLYELTDRVINRLAISKQDLQAELRELLRSIEPEDLEMQMDALRQFKLGVTTRIAAMELEGACSIMQASDGLTALAEVILDASCDIATHQLEAKFGEPCDERGEPLFQGLAVIAYGKAGGLELAYGSDLDLVLLMPDGTDGMTNGRKRVSNTQYFVRLGQRLVHILTSFTRFGVLYEIDLRLRPQGGDGPLVATLAAFARYQREQAWIWEHQALIRSRFIAGDPEVGEGFERIRHEVIQQPRDAETLRQAVVEMRNKMRHHLSSDAARSEPAGSALGRFDLKHDAGAIVDIEFMVQYAVLASAAAEPSISRWTDVMRLTDELSSAGVLVDSEVEALQRAYLTLRTAVHHEWLGLDADYDRLQAYREEIQRIWVRRMEKIPSE